MLFSALLLVAITTIADFIGAGLVVRHISRLWIIHLLVNFAIGTLLALTFLHLLPEALEKTLSESAVFWALLIGVVIAFLFERLVAWYHCHDEECLAHPTSPANKAVLLAGSSIEEFVDGAAIGLAVSTAALTQDFMLAIVTTLAVFSHELPETASKVTALVSFGVAAKRAMLLVLATTLAGFAGAAGAILFLGVFETALPILLAFAAGIFLYIATADLIPELHKTAARKLLPIEILMLILGIAIIAAISLLGLK